MNNYASIELKKDYLDKSGQSPVYIRITYRVLDKWKYKRINLGIKVFPELWNKYTRTVHKDHPQANFINLQIREALQKHTHYWERCILDKKPFNYYEFKRIVMADYSLKEGDFFEFFNKELDVTDYSPISRKNRISRMKKFNTFCNGKLDFNDLTPELIKKYQVYLREKLGNCENTISMDLRLIKDFLNKAIDKQLCRNDTFKFFKIKRIQTQREFLTLSELKILEQTETSGKYLVAKKFFLLACYTGLRAQDLLSLNESLIRTNSDGQRFIRLLMHKTKMEVLIPISSKAEPILDEILSGNLKPITQQKINEYLKVIVAKAGINKNMSLHCARHTFATVCIELEIPIEVISKLLGHTSIKITLIYARIMDATKFKEMKKWDF